MIGRSLKSISKRFLVILVLSCLSLQVSAQDIAAGEKLFKINCAQCHGVGTAKVVGPGLKGVADRVPKPANEWLNKWIKNSSAVIKSGDAYANKIFTENNKSVMPSQAVSDQEVTDILAYIANPPVKVNAVATPAADASKGSGTDSSTVLYFLIGLIILFLILINVLGGVKNSLARLVRQKQGLPEPVPVVFNSSHLKHLSFLQQKIIQDTLRRSRMPVNYICEENDSYV